MSVLDNVASDSAAPSWKWRPILPDGSASPREYVLRGRFLHADTILRIAAPIGMALAGAGMGEANAIRPANPPTQEEIAERFMKDPSALAELEARCDQIVCEVITAIGMDGEFEPISIVLEEEKHDPRNGVMCVTRLPTEVRAEVFKWAVAFLTNAGRRFVPDGAIHERSKDDRRDRKKVRRAA